MKRKRSGQGKSELCPKRTKFNNDQKRGAALAWPVLRLHYAQVSTLREYLLSVSKVKGTSKSRKRLITNYGTEGGSEDDPDVQKLLDEVIVGSSSDQESSFEQNTVRQSQELSTFSQELSESTGQSSSGSTLSQSEVGHLSIP